MYGHSVSVHLAIIQTLTLKMGAPKVFQGIQVLLECFILLTLLNCVLGEDHDKYPDKGPPLRCGTYPLDKDVSHTVQSTDYPRNYKEGNSCVWLFLGTPTCYPMLRCGNFSLQESYLCRDDYFALSDGSDKDGLGKRFCGYTSPDYSISQTSILLLTFHSDIHSHGSTGFDCTVSCAPSKTYTTPGYTPGYPKPPYGSPYGGDDYSPTPYATPYAAPFDYSPYGYGYNPNYGIPSYDARSKREGPRRYRVYRSIARPRVFRAVNPRHYDSSIGGGGRYTRPRVYNGGGYGRNASKSHSPSKESSSGAASYGGRSKSDDDKHPETYPTGYTPPEQPNYSPKPYPRQPSYLQNTPPNYLSCDCGFKGPLVEKTFRFDYSSAHDVEVVHVASDDTAVESERVARSYGDIYTDHKKYDGNVPLGKYRWMGYLRYHGDKKPYCYATLINNYYVLTAASCVTDSRGNAVDASKIEVILNDYNWKSDDDSKTVEKYVDKINKHPFYRHQDNDYDVAVLRLKQAVNLIRRSEPMLRTVCLPPRKTYKTFAYDNATVTGWGRFKNGQPEYDTLKEAYVSVITNDKCSNEYHGKITPRMICADKAYGYDKDEHHEDYSCPDDRGSPLMKLEYSRYMQIGIFSYGKDCKRENSVEVDTRVTEVNDWIRMVAKDGSWCHELDDHYKASQYKK